jgi:hypothetical protein
MAAWTWMRYSYAWNATPTSLAEGHAAWVDRYVALRGIVTPGEPDAMADLVRSSGGQSTIVVRGKGSALAAGECVVNGRVVDLSYSSQLGGPPTFRMLGVNPALSRFTGASIAGLVVGAMGVFVFTVALRHWLGERRKFGERDEGV